jgi:hypothetical protein
LQDIHYRFYMAWLWIVRMDAQQHGL